MIIHIKTNFPNDYTTRQAGEKLKEMILSCENDKIILDFKGLKVASASFFDEAIGKLSENDLKKLSVSNIYKLDYLLLQQVCHVRKVSCPPLFS